MDKKPIKASERLAKTEPVMGEVDPAEFPGQFPEDKAPLLKPIASLKQDKKKKLKKNLLTVGLIAGGLALIYLVFTFFAIGLAKEGAEFSLATLFGASTAGLLNGLVFGVYMVMLALALGAFVAVMVPLFSLLLAKKEEVERKKRAKKRIVIAGVAFFAILIAWVAAFVYLENRRDVLRININHAPIETTPADTLQLSGPVTVKFDATHADIDSKNFKAVLYTWDFGDGETEIGGQIVSHEYTTKGAFIVELSISKRNIRTGEEAKDIYVKEVSVTNQALTASFMADPLSGEAPLEVKFDASKSVDPDGQIDTYKWDVDGDGDWDDEYENETEFEYTYEKIGNYDVTLQVISVSEDYNSITKQIVVSKGETPTAVIEVQEEPEAFERGVVYIFKAGESTSPNGKIEKYEWDFGDGSPIENTKTVAHEFEREGVFNIILKVTDEEDVVGEALFEVAIGERPGEPKAVITTTPATTPGALALEGKSPFTVEFDAGLSEDSDNNIIEYEWDFDNDGRIDSYGETVDHTFAKVGTSTVLLRVIDADDNENTSTLGIKVNEPGITAKVVADPTDGEVPLTVKFDATKSSYPGGDISSFKWDFGDGTAPQLGSGTKNHKYTEIGEYTATVTAIASDNTKDSIEIYVVVRGIQVSACFDPSTEGGKAPLTVNFSPNCSTGTITKYMWDFGDGERSDELKPSHTFDLPGVYPVILEVMDSDNNVSTKTVDITVE
jgi:PKD repeat protein